MDYPAGSLAYNEDFTFGMSGKYGPRPIGQVALAEGAGADFGKQSFHFGSGGFLLIFAAFIGENYLK